MIEPDLAAATIFASGIAWTEFHFATVLSDRGTGTVPVTIYNSLREQRIYWRVVVTMGRLLAIPHVIFTFTASKQIINGSTIRADDCNSHNRGRVQQGDDKAPAFCRLRRLLSRPW
ncbi:MAG: hypothetical protein AB8B85_12365 [Paracoccaceae bacterium]